MTTTMREEEEDLNSGRRCYWQRQRKFQDSNKSSDEAAAQKVWGVQSVTNGGNLRKCHSASIKMKKNVRLFVIKKKYLMS